MFLFSLSKSLLVADCAGPEGVGFGVSSYCSAMGSYFFYCLMCPEGIELREGRGRRSESSYLSSTRRFSFLFLFFYEALSKIALFFLSSLSSGNSIWSLFLNSSCMNLTFDSLFLILMPLGKQSAQNCRHLRNYT